MNKGYKGGFCPECLAPNSVSGHAGCPGAERPASLNKEDTIAAVHAAFNQLQIAICSVSSVEHKTALPHAFRSVLHSIVTDLEVAAARLENAEGIARASLAK